MEERLCCDCEYYEEHSDGEHCKNCEKSYGFRWEPVEIEERTCDNCRHYEKWRDENPCRNCSNSYGSMWKQAKEPAVIEKRCFNCRYGDLPSGASPCKECIKLENDYETYWKPEESEEQKRSAADSGHQGESFQEFLKRRMLEKENRPKPLTIPVYNYERESSRIPDSVRVSFDDGTTAVYTLHVDQPKPLVMESIRIIRKWRSEGYQYVPRRRRRSRK